MNFFSLEKKIALLILFIALAVGAAGYVTYKSLGFLLTAIKHEAQPNLTLVLLKEISYGMQACEGNVKYYSLTGQKEYLVGFEKQLAVTQKKIEQLHAYGKGIAQKKQQIDSIKMLVDKKHRVWQEMLLISSNSKFGNALALLEEKLDSIADTISIKLPSSVIVVKPDTIRNENKPLPEDVSRKDNFFSRLFKKKESEPVSDENGVPEVMEILSETVAEKDTLLGIGIDKNFLQSEISRLRQEEGDTLRKINALEITLAHENEGLSLRINRLIAKIELNELNSIKEKAVQANKLVESTNKWAVFFLVAFALLLFTVLLVITRYVRKTNITQQALIKSKNEALELSRAKEVFMANMSHEIRTPMNAIVGFSEQLLQLPIENPAREHLSVIKKSAGHLLHIINDILDLSKLEAGKLEIESEAFSPRAVILEVAGLYKPACQAKGLNFKHYISETVPQLLTGDAFRLRQILLNLVSNAVKFTAAGKLKITADARFVARNSIQLSITVSDTGIGISTDKLGHIFDEFRQADAGTTRQYGGTGLGLSIVKKLVDLQNGKLSVNSTLGNGSEFCFSIPYKPARKLPVKPVPDIRVNGDILKNITFLVADDDEYNRRLLAFILKKWNVKFVMVTNGAELVAEFDKGRYDIILLDLRMPGMDGLQATKQIRGRKFENKPQVPIIALTATIAKDDIGRCKAAGIQSVILKPYTEAMLFSHILNVLKIDASKLASAAESQVVLGHAEMFASLYRLAGNDENFVHEMLDMFVRTSKEGVSAIEASLADGNINEVAELAHKIKTPCKHLGAGELAGLFKEIELKARNGSSVADIKPLFDTAKELIFQLIARVMAYNEITAAEPAPKQK
ncbi:MAG: response regulator [Bacteroidales bacterium]|nr:response regulator [Bacteroidales bacterium]